MKITLEHISDGQDEIIVRYRERTPGIDSIIRSLGQRRDRLYAEKDGAGMLVSPSEVLYLESVDGSVYVYLEDAVARTALACLCGLILCLLDNLLN